MQRIVSVWLPHLPIERIGRADPDAFSNDKALALVASEARGQLIAAVNSRASREGIHAGMALADARAMLPGLRSRAAEPQRDRALLLQIVRWAGRYGPSRNSDDDDGLWIDVTGVAHLFMTKVSDPRPDTGAETCAETALMSDLVSRLAASGLTARAGLADTLGAAHALARFASGAAGIRFAIARPGATQAALATLPVEVLRLTPDAVLLLRRLGLSRVGDLYGLPRAAIDRRFRDKTIAARVLARVDQALGLAAEPRRPLTEPPALSARRSYAEPLIVAAAVEAEVQSLAFDLAERLTAAGQGLRRLVLSLYRSDASAAMIGAGTSRACRDPRHLFDLLAVKLADLDAGFGIDAIGLDAVTVERLDAEQTALAPSAGTGGDAGPARRKQGDPSGTGVLIDRLANRLGTARVLRLACRPSHHPERSAAALPALLADDRPRLRLDGPESDRGYSPRPPFLLPRPEPITVIAEVPEGAPARFTWRRLARRVVKADGPERIAPEWWRALRDSTSPVTGTGIGPRAIRDYYHLEDEAGGRYWVFRAGLYHQEGEGNPPTWYMHGLFP